MIELPYVFVGALVGLVLSAIVSPPTRKTPRAPTPNDPTVYRQETGCVRAKATEVPCPSQPDSLNLLASQHK